MSVLIGGGSGFIGRHLTKMLSDNGYSVFWVSRMAGGNRITWSQLRYGGLKENFTAVVSLSGENILNPKKRWNWQFKNQVRESRIECNKILVDAICQAKVPPKVFISVSSVAIYRPDCFIEYDEDTQVPAFDFISKLCHDWEAAAKLPDGVDVRQVVLRCGTVLGVDGGIVQQLYIPYLLGLGGRFGSGHQWFPWIHVKDVAGLVTYAIMNDHVSGILNAVAPDTVRNAQFAKAFARVLRRPAIVPMPGFVLKTALGAERSQLILDGQKVLPKRTLEMGYKFFYPSLPSACCCFH